MTQGDQPGPGPKISDDGRFWWDGERWQPLASAPPPLTPEQAAERQTTFDRIDRDLGRAQGCLTASLWLTLLPLLLVLVLGAAFVIWIFVALN